MTIQDNDVNKMGAVLAFVPVPLPHYCDDEKTQRRVGMAISACRQPPDFRVRTIWL